MRNNTLVFLLILGFLAVQPAFSQLPDFYKQVDRLTWVVQDMDKVLEGWRTLGFTSIQEFGEVDLMGEEYQGKPVQGRARVAAGRVGTVNVTWLQPISGETIYSEFLKRKGEGVLSLSHRVPSPEALEAEIKRLAGVGVNVLGKGTIATGSGDIVYVYFDTEAEGKYALGLVYFPPGMEGDPAHSGPLNLKLSQYAFVVRDLDPVSKYWQKLGFPEMSVTHGQLTNLKHRGQPGHFDQKLGWQRHGTIVYEWILPIKGPTVYEEHMKIHGEGFHHLAFDVPDMDKAEVEWSGLGFPIVQSGGWGEEGKPGSGRFSYADTTAIGGVTVEFLWNYEGK